MVSLHAREVRDLVGLRVGPLKCLAEPLSLGVAVGLELAGPRLESVETTPLEHLMLHRLHVQEVNVLSEEQARQLVLRSLGLVGTLTKQCITLRLQRLVSTRWIVVVRCHHLHLTASLSELGLQLNHRLLHAVGGHGCELL